MHQQTVLIIDDSVEDRETYRRYLMRDPEYRYQILEAGLGAQGLEQCRLVRPDLILLEFMLPDLDGLAFLAELQRQGAQPILPVIMLTGQGNETIAVQAMKAGAQDYLIKGKTTPEGFCCAVRSVLKNISLRQKLHHSEERFHTSVENMLDCFGIYSAIRDGAGQITDFRIDYANTAACQSYGLTGEGHLGQSLRQLLPKHWATHLFEEYCQVVETGQPFIKDAWTSMDLDQNQAPSYKTIDIRVAKLGDGYVATWRDVTEWRRAEIERAHLLVQEQTARAHAEAANRAKDEFVAMVSHDLRDPLNAILGWTQLLRSHQFNQLTQDAMAQRALETIERNAKVQAKLLEDLLDISRAIQGKLRLELHPLNLGPAVETAANTVYLTAQDKGVSLSISTDPGIGSILGDAQRLQQVLSNLLSNAVKFTPPGGDINVRLQQINGFVQLTVQDTGQGIHPDFLPYVFDRFRQSQVVRSKDGLGLGLAIARHLVELHHGTICLESPGEGLGTTVTLRLPLLKREV